jgi:hypothetical protein
MKLRCAILFVAMMLSAVPSMGQGCAMCYTSAAGSTKEGQRAISNAVMILLLPPLGFMSLGIGLAFRYGRKRDSENNA